jgi:hypothetical protein
MPNTDPSASVVPLAEINNHPETGLRWHLPLPSYISSHLGVDLETVGALARWGALDTVTVTQGSAAHEDQPAIGGVQGDGTAAASASLNLFRRRQETTWGTATISRHPDNYMLADATIAVDPDAIASQLSRQGQLRNVESWREALNNTTRRGLGSAAVAHLVGRSKHVDTRAALVATTTEAMIQLQLAGTPQTPEQILEVAALMLTILGVGASVTLRALESLTFRKIKGRDAEIPFGLLPCNADRLAMFGLQALRRRNPVRVLE